MSKKITVTFDLNELQWETLKRFAALQAGWQCVDLVVRYEGENKLFQADFLRDLCEQVEKEQMQ